MVNIDLSKMVPRASLSPLSAFIPGLFFEISIVLGNPQLITSHLATAQNLIRLSSYLQLAIALFLAFIIGNAAMLFVSLIQWLLCYFHRLKRPLREEFNRSALLPLINRLAGFQFFMSRMYFQRFRTRILKRAADPEKPAELATHAWHRVARKLLKDRYDIDLSDLEEEWEFLFWSLGSPTDVEIRGDLLTIASEATGWCGLAATALAPTLRTPYYLAICAFFILIGLIHDYFVALRRTAPLALAIGRTRALLREYEKDRGTRPHTKEPSAQEEDDSK